MAEKSLLDRIKNREPEPSPTEGTSSLWNTARRMLVPGGMALDSLERANEQDVGMMGNMSLGMQKGMTFNARDHLAAFASALEEPGFDYGAAKEKVDTLSAGAAARAGMSDDVGEMMGMLMPGAAMVKGAQTIGRGAGALGTMVMGLVERSAAARIGAGAVMGAAENAAYQAVGRGNLDDAGIDALYGAGGGLIGTAVFSELAAPLAGWAQKQLGLKSKDAAVDAVRKAIKGNFVSVEGTDGFIKFDADDPKSWQAAIADAPPDAKLLDMFPEALVPLIKQRGTTADADVRDALWPVMAHVRHKQNSAAAEFQDLAAETLDFSSPADFMSKEQMTMATKNTRQELSHKYDAVIDGSDFSTNAVNINRIIQRNFAGLDLPTDNKLLQQLRDLVGETKVPVMNSAGKQMRDQRGRPVFKSRKLDARQVLSIRKQLDDIGYSGNFQELSTSKASSATKEQMKKIREARNAIKVMMHRNIDGLEDLDAVYASDADFSRNFDLGKRLFSDNKEDMALTQALYDPDMSAYSRKAMLDGAKWAVRSDLAGKQTPAQVRNYMRGNAHRMSKLRAIFTKEQMDAMDAGVKEIASAVEVGKLKLPPMPQRVSVLEGVPGALDYAIAGSGVSKAAQIGALRRIASRQGEPGPIGMNEELSSLALQSPDQAATTMSQNLAQRGPVPMDAGMVGGASGVAAGNMRPEEQAPPVSMLDMIRASQSGLPPGM